MAAKKIKHDGRITAIHGSNITVTILSKSACTSCEAKGLCNSSEIKDKDIDIKYFGTETWEVDQLVNVAMKPSMGSKAVLYGYLFPFLFLIAALIAVSAITPNEIIVGLSALGGVVLYFVILWLFREKLNDTFIFEIEKFVDTQSICK